MTVRVHQHRRYRVYSSNRVGRVIGNVHTFVMGPFFVGDAGFDDIPEWMIKNMLIAVHGSYRDVCLAYQRAWDTRPIGEMGPKRMRANARLQLYTKIIRHIARLRWPSVRRLRLGSDIALRKMDRARRLKDIKRGAAVVRSRFWRG